MAASAIPETNRRRVNNARATGRVCDAGNPDLDRTKAGELSRIKPRVRRKVSVLRRKLQFEPLAGLLAQRQHLRVDRYPSPACRVVTLAAFLCLQWRDRAGISPDFSFKPNAGTVGQHH
jgi:hypothetical protein